MDEFDGMTMEQKRDWYKIKALEHWKKLRDEGFTKSRIYYRKVAVVYLTISLLGFGFAFLKSLF